MITRTVIEIQLWTLVLNRMTAPKIEMATVIMASLDRQKLVDYYTECYLLQGYVDVINDVRWHKSFKRGSLLEWFNPVSSLTQLDTFGHGLHENWVRREELDRILAEGKIQII
jgi:hypothetical protein